jgi:hypothetical protein
MKRRTERSDGSMAFEVGSLGERQAGGAVGFALWIAAVILVVVGIVQLFQGQILLGILLIVVGCLVGPGGYSIFHRR